MRYLRLTLFLLRYHLLRNLEFRMEVVSWWLVNLMWPLLALLSVNFIFGQINSVVGWTKNEVLLVVCLQEIFIGVIWICAIPSLLEFTNITRLGGFDQFLLRPVSLRFQVSFNKFEFDQYPRLLLMGFLAWKVLSSIAPITPINIISGLILFAIGVILFYNLYFLIATTVFWFTRLFNLEDFFDSLMNFGRFPIYIFNGGLRFTLTYVIPAAFMSTFPVQALLGKLNGAYIPIGLFAGVISYVGTQWFWNFAIKRYSSASS